MTFLTDTSHFKPLGKRPIDHGGCQYTSSPPENFKCLKVDAISHFPKNVGSPASRTTAISSKVVSGVVAMPTGISLPKDLNSESNNLAVIPFDNILVHQNKVKEALDLFEDIFQKLLVENEAQSKGKGKGKGNSGKLVHAKAAMRLKEQHKWINTEKLLGSVPGVEVGDRFRFRVELVIIGLHHQFQGGIDYMKKDGKILATSIVASGKYENDAESADVLMYSGQGGNPLVVDKKPEDQKLGRGNLALKNSMDERTPVRVIRGHQTLQTSNVLGTSSQRNFAYVYDGLYIVTSCKQQRGPYGKLVFMFQLNRIPGQLELTRNILKKPRSAQGITRMLTESRHGESAQQR